MPGIAHDSSSGHEKDPWRSIVRERQNDDFALPVSRFATSAAATRRTLRAIREHPAYVTTGQFRLSKRTYVSKERIDELVALAEAATAEAESTPNPAPTCRRRPSFGG